MNKLVVLLVLVGVTSTFAEMRLDCDPFCDALDFSKFGWPFPPDNDRVRFNKCVTDCKTGNEKTTSCCNECKVDCTGDRALLGQADQQCMNKCTGYYVSVITAGTNINYSGGKVSSIVDCPKFCDDLDFSQRGWPFPEDKERVGYNRCLKSCESNNKRYKGCCNECSISDCEQNWLELSVDNQTCMNRCTGINVLGLKPPAIPTSPVPELESTSEKSEEPPK